MHRLLAAAALLMIATPALADVGRVEVVGKPGARCALAGQEAALDPSGRTRFETVAVGGYTLRCTSEGVTLAGPVMVRAGRTTRTSLANLRSHMLKARKKTRVATPINLAPPRQPTGPPPQSPSTETDGSSESLQTPISQPDFIPAPHAGKLP